MTVISAISEVKSLLGNQPVKDKGEKVSRFTALCAKMKSCVPYIMATLAVVGLVLLAVTALHPAVIGFVAIVAIGLALQYISCKAISFLKSIPSPYDAIAAVKALENLSRES